MSPRAASRLVRYGFTEVRDYQLGKNDWLANDLPREGEARLAGDEAVRDLPTCDEDEQVAAVGDRLTASPLDALVVTDGASRPVGLLPPQAARDHPEARVGEVMHLAPTTVRPNEDLEALRHRMRHADRSWLLLTRPDGVLVGALLAG